MIHSCLVCAAEDSDSNHVSYVPTWIGMWWLCEECLEQLA